MDDYRIEDIFGGGLRNVMKQGAAREKERKKRNTIASLIEDDALAKAVKSGDVEIDDLAAISTINKSISKSDTDKLQAKIDKKEAEDTANLLGLDGKGDILGIKDKTGMTGEGDVLDIRKIGTGVTEDVAPSGIDLIEQGVQSLDPAQATLLDTTIRNADGIESVKSAIAGENVTAAKTAVKEDAYKTILDSDRRGEMVVSSTGKRKFLESKLEKERRLQEERDNKVQASGLAALDNALGEDAKALLQGDKGYYSMFGQVYSLSSYMNAREVEIDAAGLTGNAKVRAVKAAINSHPLLQMKGFERTGAIPGATGFTILRTVPNITGSKQGLAAMAKMITPSYPTKWTSKPYSNQMLVQSLDDGFRFKVAAQRTNLLQNLGYKVDKNGKFILPNKPSESDKNMVRDAMERVVLTSAETELLEAMKQVALDAAPAKLYTSSQDINADKYVPKDATSERLEYLRKKYGRR